MNRCNQITDKGVGHISRYLKNVTSLQEMEFYFSGSQIKIYWTFDILIGVGRLQIMDYRVSVKACQSLFF